MATMGRANIITPPPSGAVPQQDISPFIDVSQPAPFMQLPASYANPSVLPRTGGNVNNNQNQGALGPYGSAGVDMLMPGAGGAINYFTGSGNITDLIDPSGGLGLLGGLFGGDNNSWRPYIDQNGNYVFQNPRRVNPVPLANVPGAPLTPSGAYRKTAGNIQAITDLLPYFNQAVNATGLPTALSQLQTAQATSGPYAALMTNLYNQYGPQLNAIGNEIARRNMLAQASNENEVMQGPGRQSVESALQLMKLSDPEFFSTRSLASNRLGDLMNNIDLSGALSGTERDEISKGLARQNAQAGLGPGSPSQTNIVGNAMQYGQAAYQRRQQAQDSLGRAISAASAFLPNSRTGMDPFQVATGRSSQPNTGNALFPGINQSGSSQGQNLGNQIFGGINSLQGLQMNIDANKKDWLDKMNQITSSVRDVGSIAGAAFGGL